MLIFRCFKLWFKLKPAGKCPVSTDRRLYEKLVRLYIIEFTLAWWNIEQLVTDPLHDVIDETSSALVWNLTIWIPGRLLFVLFKRFFGLHHQILDPTGPKGLLERRLQVLRGHLAARRKNQAFSFALEREEVVRIYSSSAVYTCTRACSEGVDCCKTRTINHSLAGLFLVLQLLLHLSHEIVFCNTLNLDLEDADLKNWHFYALTCLDDCVRAPFTLLFCWKPDCISALGIRFVYL